MQSTPSSQNDEQGFNADRVIERFGGIRPMASKMNVPVTTVQGWKKRNVIPGNRRDEVIAAAALHRIDLSGAMDGVAVAQGVQETVTQSQSTGKVDGGVTSASAAPSVSASAAHSSKASAPYSAPRGQADLEQIKRQARRSAMMSSVAVLAIFVGATSLLLAMGKKQLDQANARVAVLERDVEAVQYTTDSDKAVTVARDLTQRITDLKKQADGLKTNVMQLKDQAEGIAAQIKAADVAGLMARLYTLEQHVAGIAGASPELSDMLARLGDMQTTLEGQAQLQNSLADLKTLVDGMQGRVGEMDITLKSVQDGDSALAQTLQGVSPADLKAAALLLALTQVRETAAREQPFYDDLVLLQTMVGDKDPELTAAIERMAPLAQHGVLTPNGLSSELRGLTGDIVVSSLSGDGVSVQDKALARLNNVLKIQKDGELITGTDTQARVARAQVMLDQGDVEGALAELQALRGPAAHAAQPLIDQAELTVMAQQLQSMVTDGVMRNIARARTTGGGLMGSVTSAPITSGHAPIMMPNE